jgi:mRNA-degrading endonuclease RelE of RelBE toxin-antitoxin system
MKLYLTEKFKKQYQNLSPPIQALAKKQLAFLMSNPQHPSLNIKKMNDPRNIWEGRVTYNYRFTFQIEGEHYILRTIGTHDTLKKP